MRNWFLLVFALVSCKTEDPSFSYPDITERKLAGGGTTVINATSNAFSFPAPNLTEEDLKKHLLGDVQFQAVFVTAPANVNSGLGPIFNNSSCISCHPRDGRAAFPNDLNARSGFFLRASVPGEDSNGGPLSAPGFGLQIQNQALFGYIPEAKFKVTYTQLIEKFSDGITVTLQKPEYSLIEPYNALPANLLLSPRIGSPIFGLGLLEAITEKDILANVDENDSNKDGISGKANYVFDIVSGTKQLGRFGWKANTATILEQCAAAYVHDMGVTNLLFPHETGKNQFGMDDNLKDDPEITTLILESVAFYCKTLAVPASRNHSNENVRRGAKLFEDLNCNKCHIPKFKTGFSPISAISYQTIFPYTDMLLHDMGDGLSDNRPDYLATGKEWKTRPLWGIGLTQLINGHTHFLHDGRAKNLTEAILWHGGEAQKAKEDFKKLSEKDRQALLDFLNTL